MLGMVFLEVMILDWFLGIHFIFASGLWDIMSGLEQRC